MLIILLTLLNLVGLLHLKDIKDNLERYIFPCHTTDFICFKRQFKALKDHVLLGNEQLGIDMYKPYVYKYGDSGTCIKLSGIEESDLVFISYSSKYKEFSMTIDMPFRIQQIKNFTKNCVTPDRGELKRFSGNATVKVTYPYTLRRIKNDTYLSLEDENLDMIIDIPDLSHFNKESRLEGCTFIPSGLIAWSSTRVWQGMSYYPLLSTCGLLRTDYRYKDSCFCILKKITLT